MIPNQTKDTEFLCVLSYSTVIFAYFIVKIAATLRICTAKSPLGTQQDPHFLNVEVAHVLMNKNWFLYSNIKHYNVN